MDRKLLLTTIILPFIDYFYLSNVSNHFNTLIQKITKEKMNFNNNKAIIAYIFLILGIYHFIIKDINIDNIKQKLKDAFILGIVIYGTFDFTNGSIFQHYDLQTSIIDTLWGGTLFTIVTYCVFHLLN